MSAERRYGTTMRTSVPVPVLALLAVLVLRTGTGAENADSVVEQSSNMTVRAGKHTTIHFNTGASVHSCVWLYESPERDRTPTVIVGFPGHGPDSSDCSLDLYNVSQIQTGWWTCRAETINSTVLHSTPIFLQVRTSPVVTFEAQPVNRTFSIGSTMELECKTATAVQSCQWSFQQEGQSEPIVLREGPPRDDKDCSLSLEQVSYEQVGTWRCGARVYDTDNFTFADTVNIQVEHKDEAFPIEFEKEPEDTEVYVGQTTQLSCQVREEAHIEACRWYWQPVGHSQAWRVLMREFLPAGNDCSIQFANVTADPEGLWLCQVKPIHSPKFIASKSAKLTVKGALSTSTLTREVSVSEGEPLTIQCVAEEAAKSCEWKRKALYETDVSDKNGWTVIESFGSSGIANRDCSLQYKYARKEHQGLWVCSVKFEDDKPFLDAIPSAVLIKSPRGKVQFAEGVRTQVAAEDQPLRLECSTLSPVRECVWMWYEEESKVAERVVKFNFTSKHSGYDCGVTIPTVDRSLQGIWQCSVQHGDPTHPNITYARPFSLTVVKTGPISFRDVSRVVRAEPGRSSLLACVVREPVQECLWMRQLSETQQFHEFTRFEPVNFNNCSLNLLSVSSGWWVCGVRSPGEVNFTMASPTRVELVEKGEVLTRSLVSTSDTLMLVCQLTNSLPDTSCNWIHPSGYNVFQFNTTEKYTMKSSPELGVCSLSFQPKLVDIGDWKCVFSLNNETHILGAASFTVLSSPQNVRLSWVVGILATVTLMLTVLLFVVLTCRFHQCNRSHKGTVQLNSCTPEKTKRYSEDPTKGINFSFTESPELLVDFSIPSQESHSHHYERVGRLLPHHRSFYQNVE